MSHFSFKVLSTLLVMVFTNVAYGINQNPTTSLCRYNKNFSQALQFKKQGAFDKATTYFEKAFSETKSGKDTEAEITCLYWLGNTYLSQDNTNASLHCFLTADSLLTKMKKRHPLFMDVKYMMGLLYYKKAAFQHSLMIFDACLKQLKTFPASDSIVTRIIYKKGVVEYMMGYHMTAIKSFEDAKDKGMKAFGKNSIFMADVLNALGVLNFMTNRYDDALSYYMQTEALIKQNHMNYSFGLASAYNNIGLIFKEKGDFVNALHFLNNALKLYLSDYNEGKTMLTNVYINISTIQQKLGKYDQQLTYLKLSSFYAQKYSPAALPKILWMFATYYTNIKDFKNTEKYYNLSVSKCSGMYKEGPELAYVLHNYGYFIENFLHNHQRALTLYNQSLKLHLKLFGLHSASTGVCYYNIGNTYFEKKDFQKALFYYHKAMLATTEKDENQNPFHISDINTSLKDIDFADILKARAKTFEKLAEQQPHQSDKILFYRKAFESSESVLRIIDKIRDGYVNEESRLYLSENELHTYQTAIKYCLVLYRLTNNPDYLNHAFIFADKEHASSLQAVLKENNMPAGFRLKDSLFAKELLLKKDLSVYHELVIREKTSKHVNLEKLNCLNQEEGDLTLKIENIHNKLRNKNPLYNQLIFNDNPGVQITSIQKILSVKEALLEYFYSDTTLYVFCLTKSQLQYKEIALTPSFEKNIEKVCAYIRQPRVYESDVAYANDYKRAGWDLYSMLLKPFDSVIRNRDLIIVPCEKLNYIPFETLLTDSCIFKKLSFKQLPYLVKSNCIRYVNASCLLGFKNEKNLNGKAAAFIPVYINSKGFGLTGNPDNEAFATLKQTEAEGNALRKYFPAKLFKSNQASEENFKKEARKFGSLHLAMHAVIDDENSLYSRLIFTPHSSTSEDDLLYAYEIYNLNINVQMLVLSACNTGYGKLRKGEGMMSLTRSFAFAGVPSMVTSLWAVNDNTSATLMNSFYKELSGGINKDAALSNAKKQYLDKADIIEAHPYYWAGYVLIGDNAPLVLDKPFNFRSVCIVLILITLIVFWILRKRYLNSLSKALTNI